MAWSDQQVEQLCAMLAEGKTTRQIAGALGFTRGKVTGRLQRMRAAADPRLPADRRTPGRLIGDYRAGQGDYERRPPHLCTAGCGARVWSKASRCKPCSQPKRGAPDDFAQLAATMRNTALALHYGTNTTIVARWREESGIAAPPAQWAEPAPPRFDEIVPTLTKAEAKERFGCGDATFDRWCTETGAKPKRAPVGRPPAYSGPQSVRAADNRCRDRADRAAEFLQRFGPVFRCRADGRADAKGGRWRRGPSILTDAELISRAERNGWRPDAWREVRPS